jgi:Mce-associated membrane protein
MTMTEEADPSAEPSGETGAEIDAEIDARLDAGTASAGSASTDTDTSEPRAVPKTKAEKLEAKAARLRERQEAKERAAKERAAAPVTVASTPAWIVPTLTAIAVVFAIAFAITLPWGLHQRHVASTSQKLDKARASALSAAKQYAVDFGSYDYQKLDEDFQVVASHLTKDFATKYAKVSSDLKQIIVQYKGKSTATVQGAAVASATTTKATVLVFLDQSVTTSQSSTARLDRNRLEMSLEKQGSTWLIADLSLK